ncbi:MAG: PQQ-dependent dehydrogenase, methanol/ethanol family [Bryobacterales bacterium]|nr:PQQ-dependent dehydrogenase, methanol/ethanol family [Bryobacterales bacterium]
MKSLALFALGATLAAQTVPYERIRDAEKEPHNWLTYSGNYNGQRYSPLDLINTNNVKRLKVAWVHHTNTTESHETTPIVVDGIMFLTEGPNVVKSIDTRTGNLLWRYQKTIPQDLRLCCGRPNRGVAILNDTVYYGSIDAHFLALDAKTGRLKWDIEMADHKLGYSSTVAPLAVKDKIILGVAGGEYGIRGFLDAYDAKTGKRVWRFHTIPGPDDKDFGTWEGDSWKMGSAAIWTTGSYDPATNTTIWGTGNPGPDWNGDVRKGDNLYSCSFVGLDVDTGKKKWHFQFTPHDTHDWDATQVPVLIDGTFRGAPAKMVTTANRNGFYYVLDRTTGKFLAGKPFVKQTWAKGLDDNGKPMVLPGSEPTEEGNLVWPSLAGGTNWHSPSYSPQTNLFYVAAREQGAYFYKGEAEYKPGVIFNGGGQRNLPDEQPYGAIRALDATTGNLKWEFRTQTPQGVGVLSTKGGLLFTGTTQGDFFALHAATGELLWRFKTNGGMNSNAMSYAVDGKQYVAAAIGRSLYVFDLMEP